MENTLNYIVIIYIEKIFKEKRFADNVDNVKFNGNVTKWPDFENIYKFALDSITN